MPATLTDREPPQRSGVQAGKISCLVLVVLIAATATVVRVLMLDAYSAEDASLTMRIVEFAAIVGGVCFVVLLPVGVAVDRTIANLRTSIEGASGAAVPVVPPGVKIMRPVARAFDATVDVFRQREQALRSQLSDLEIRHRVSEAERRQIEAVLHSLRDAVIVTDAFNEIVMANQAAAGIFGFDRKTAIHKPLDQAIADRSLSQLVRDARDSTNFNDARHVEHVVVGAGADKGDQAKGTVYDVTLACVENHKHEVAGVVTILHDLTRERELSQMKSDFVAKASHELRTPLSSIRAYVEMLVDGEATDEKARHEFYRIMQNETERLSRLIDNMLNISRIEAGIVQIDRENVDIKALVGRAMHTLEPQAKEKSISLHQRLSAVDLCVEGDADMLYQVVLNLLSNAVKYTPEGGRVTVSADSDNLTRSVLVSVADTGLGIPPDSLPKLFDKFYRVENYKRVAKGTGLGLSLCKHIVEMVHHGQVGVDSKLGMGSKFWFSVPMRYAGSRAAA
jgi:two-component system, OmpR family, phosphate regulon sensor histidine kinase PhoR